MGKVKQALRGDLGHGVGTRGQRVKLTHVVEDGGGQNSSQSDASDGRHAEVRNFARSGSELLESRGGGRAGPTRAYVYASQAGASVNDHVRPRRADEAGTDLGGSGASAA